MTQETYNAVQVRYGNIAKRSHDTQQFSNANSVEDSLARAFGYSEEDLASLPEKANLGVSCGTPVAVAGIKEGETVVDLGSGAGIDVFLASRKVGPQGKAIGVDMTEEMISLACRNAGHSNLQNTLFIQSPITSIPLEDSTVDCIISNCVINLVPHKDKPAPGGRVAISDILARRELPVAILDDMALYVGCIAGASQVTEYQAWLEGVGLTDILFVDAKANINLYKQSSDTGQGSCCGAAKKSVRLPVSEFADVDFNAWVGSFQIYAVKARSAERGLGITCDVDASEPAEFGHYRE
ncbi:UbiE/COQ5 family methyltransferase [Aspergillus pseudodeflectus]|uniref:Arsenite methyltransferase n=1 Tax=Aspergillus pseudodeflectus TaxID=176178 RepID=A0ABR4J7U2_9EURO